MKRIHSIAAAVVLSLGVAACGNDSPSSPNTPAPKTGDAAGTSIATQTPAPPAPPDRDSPPSAPPATHTGSPQPVAPPATTARDTDANKPLGDLTKAQESNAMPKAGQVNNHSSPAMDEENKTTTPGADKSQPK